MGYPTPIEWTDATWNCVGGCSIKSPGCANCYAQLLAGTRLDHLPLYAGTTSQSKAGPVFNGKMTAAPAGADVWTWPLRWRGAKTPKLGAGMPSLIFVGDMADLFHEDRPREDIGRAVAGIIYSRHIGQFLTKRAEVMADYVINLRESGDWFDFTHPQLGKPNFAPEANFTIAVLRRCWFGFSAERQQEFDERWPHIRRLAQIGATIFVSYEPALGPLKLPADFLGVGQRAQVIFGGESGKGARPPHPDWPRAVRDQCLPAGVAYFHKQWGQFKPSVSGQSIAPDGSSPGPERWNNPSTAWMSPVGKARAGRLLDDREHSEFPRAVA